MNPKLDDYQIKAVEQLKTGSILCGGVGSGKSRTGLAYYFIKVGHGYLDGKKRGYESDYVPMTLYKDLYIITIARKRDDLEWEDELIPFLLHPKEDQNFYNGKVKVVIDSWNNIKKYTNITGAFFIFDEQKVVGSGQWARSFIKIAKNNDWIVLTATPGDTWQDYASIFVANGFYKNRTEFLNRHAVYNRYSKYPQIDRYLDELYLERLRSSILVEMDYKNPTTRHYENIPVDYDRWTYKRVMKDRWNVFTEQPIESVPELCYILRKIVNSDMSRCQMVMQIVDEHPRVIIFYNFDYELEILRGLPYEDNTVVAEYNGHKHEPVPSSERWVYLVQYNSAAEAWNCTATDTVLFYSLNYSYKIFEQSCGRIDRRNTQYKDLYYYKLLSKAPIDMAISRALARKKNFNESRYFYKK